MFKNIFQKRKTVGLALGSGGIKGLAHIGVIQTLLENDIPIDYIAGSSIGALIGANYALHGNLEQINKIIDNKHHEQLAYFFDLGLTGGLVKGEKIKKLLGEWFDDKQFKDTTIPFQAVSTNILNGQPRIFAKGKLVDGIRASTSVPSLFKPTEDEDKILIDGGVSDPVPVDIVKKMGADIVIAVNLDNYSKNDWFKKEDVKSITKISGRSLDLMRHYIAQYSCQQADILIEPKYNQSEAMIWKKYFVDGQKEEIIKSGQEATQAMIKKIKKIIED